MDWDKMNEQELKWSWFERHFEFNFPPQKLPDLVERLRGTPTRITSLLRLIDSSLLCKRLEDSWSIQENIGHLLALEPLWLGRFDDILEGKNHLREADLTNKSTFEANYNEVQVNQIVSRFTSLREEMVNKLESVQGPSQFNSSTHPRLKISMRVVDLAYFVAEHDDYHLARITFLNRTLGL